MDGDELKSLGVQLGGYLLKCVGCHVVEIVHEDYLAAGRVVDDGGNYLLHVRVALSLGSAGPLPVLVFPVLGVNAPLDEREVEVFLNSLVVAVGDSEQSRLNADDLFDYGVRLVYLLLALLRAYLSEVCVAP